MATSPGPTASTSTPRRIGTERQTEARSARIRSPMTVLGIVRGSCWSVSMRASSRGILRAARWVGTAPVAIATRLRDEQQGEEGPPARRPSR